jgi:hypothetical protein
MCCRLLKRYYKFLGAMNDKMSDPQPLVPNKLRYCLLARYPPARILVGSDAQAIGPLCFLLPDAVADFLKRKLTF